MCYKHYKFSHILFLKGIDACGVDSFSPSSLKPQEEGMMNKAARFSLSKKPRYVDQERSRQTTEGDACLLATAPDNL
jgi:hypothetical protein